MITTNFYRVLDATRDEYLATCLLFSQDILNK